jgi:AraC-like DNA-binding protein
MTNGSTQQLMDTDFFNKIEVNESLFVEYICTKEKTKFEAWSKNQNYFAFVTSGKKTWMSTRQSYEINAGDIIFVKKGSMLTHHFYDHKFCAIFIFIPDDFIKEFLIRNTTFLRVPSKNISYQDAVIPITRDELLDNYERSIRSYLALSKRPHEQLLKLKFEELLLSLFSNKEHQDLTDYFISLGQNEGHQRVRISKVMEGNFTHNFKLQDYAKLCCMSITTFHRSFKLYYNTTPGVWLKDRRLDFARHQILTSDLSINQISFKSGFDDPSYFVRSFRQKYNLTPFQYRQNYLKKTVNVLSIVP